MRRLHASGIALALLTVLTSGPAVATACAMLCAPSLHEHAAAAHQGATACHHAGATRSIVAAASDHDCRTHLGASRDVLATLTSVRNSLDPQSVPAIVAQGTRTIAITTARQAASYSPPLDPVPLQYAPLVLRI